ncbi:MAG: hypothetical protein DHS20C09_07080 [marine bacterium B5-7]|nr:MAG: hypothetical protein DHS20C09_07080 [marine bacterium B5-7]
MIKFEFDNNLSSMDAISMVIDLALYSNYYPHGSPPFRGVSDVARYLEQRGLTLPKCAEQCRDFSENPKYFYNLIGPTWTTKGVSVSRPDPKTGEQKTIISGDGQYHTANYWAKFDQSLSDFNRALTDANHELLLSAFAKGQASIENFLNVLNIEGIETCSVETKLKKVFLFTKPSGDWNAKRSDQPWSSFLEMKQLRNQIETHNKNQASGYTFDEMLKHFNLYIPAISKTLVKLHILLRVECPASIIRSSYHPIITMKTSNEDV